MGRWYSTPTGHTHTHPLTYSRLARWAAPKTLRVLGFGQLMDWLVQSGLDPDTMLAPHTSSRARNTR